jgi:hypothetical protein
MERTSRNVHELETVVERSEAGVDNVPDATRPNEDGNIDGQSLPPYDGGKAAWRLLLAAFVFEALLWGIAVFACGHSKC